MLDLSLLIDVSGPELEHFLYFNRTKTFIASGENGLMLGILQLLFSIRNLSETLNSVKKIYFKSLKTHKCAYLLYNVHVSMIAFYFEL